MFPYLAKNNGVQVRINSPKKDKKRPAFSAGFAMIVRSGEPHQTVFRFIHLIILIEK